MEQSEIYAKLTDIFHDLFDDDAIVLTPQTTAKDIDEWDSFNHINLIVAVESRFQIKFQTSELETLRNVGELVDKIEQKLKSR